MKEVKMIKGLIAYSGPQINGFVLSDEAIMNMNQQKTKGVPLINMVDYKEGKECGWLEKTELVRNEALDRLELWGYFGYVPDKTDFTKSGKCAYQIAYNEEDFDDERVLHKAELIGCSMLESLE